MPSIGLPLRSVVLSSTRQSSRDEKRDYPLALDIKAYAVQNELRLKTKVVSQHLGEFGGMPRLFGGPKLPFVDPVAVARRLVSDQRIRLSQRSEVLHVRRDVIETERRVDDARVELSAPAQREAQAQQHLIFGNLHAPFGQQFLCACENADVHDRLDLRSASDPGVIRILDQLLPQPSRGAIVDGLADVVLVRQEGGDHAVGPRTAVVIGDARVIQLAPDVAVRSSAVDE